MAVRTRLQRILGLDQQRRRRLMPDPLQRRENLDDRGAPLVERFAKQLFLLVERLEARLRRLDARLDIAHARRGVDELLVERAPIVAERVDLALELRLAFRRLALPRARRFEFLIALFEGVRHRPSAARSAQMQRAAMETWTAGAWPPLAGAWADGVCARAAKSAPSGRAKAKAEPSTRRGSVRLDRRRIMVSKGRCQAQERKTKQSRCDRIKTQAGAIRHKSVRQH